MTSKEKIKYYIIKDLDTGLYYRGKGQNRWGKYYNQASIFRNLAQAHNSVEELKRYYKSNAVAIEIEINEQTNTSFSECIKEWEDRGYIIELGITHMWISTVDDNTVATFDLSDKCVTTSLFIDYELSILITKTLKALEEMKDESR